jgi:hypothetical protein
VDVLAGVRNRQGDAVAADLGAAEERGATPWVTPSMASPREASPAVEPRLAASHRPGPDPAGPTVLPLSSSMDEREHFLHGPGRVGDRELHRADDRVGADQQAQALEPVDTRRSEGRQ